MKAVRINTPGGYEALSVEELPIPTPDAGQVVVKNKVVGLNFIDTYFRSGAYPKPTPFTLGLEAAGVVHALGEGVTNYKVGDRVAYVFPAAYADYTEVPSNRLIPLPEGIDFSTGCTAIIQGMTAQYLVRSTYAVKPGDNVLIQASAGGMGLMLSQLCNHLGATVIGTCSSKEKAEISKNNGVHHVINYTEEDFVESVKKITDNKGVQVVYDGVGKTTFLKGFDCLARRGYMVLYGAASGKPDPIDPAYLVQKGSVFLTRPSLNDYIVTEEELVARSTEVFKWIADDVLKISIGATYSLDDVATAHKDLQERKIVGKALFLLNN